MKTIGTIRRDGYRIDKVVLAAGQDQLALPGLLFVPETVSKSPVLHLHGVSMKAEANPGGHCEQLAKQGHMVLSAELSGIGETETGHDKRDYGRGRFGRDVQEIYLAYLMGRSFVGMRTTDVFCWSDYLSRYESNEKPLPIQVVATGEAAIPALHAAALDPSRFENVLLTGMIRSWAEVVAAPESLNQLVNAVHGALRHYDLPDLVELAGNERVRVEQPVDASGRGEDGTQNGHAANAVRSRLRLAVSRSLSTCATGDVEHQSLSQAGPINASEAAAELTPRHGITTNSLPMITAPLLAPLTALDAGDASSKPGPNTTVMLAGDWLPEDPHRIDYEKLPRVKAEHVIISDVRDDATGLK